MAAVARLIPFFMAAAVWLLIGLLVGLLVWRGMTEEQRDRYSWITTMALVLWPILFPVYLLARAGRLQDELYRLLEGGGRDGGQEPD